MDNNYDQGSIQTNEPSFVPDEPLEGEQIPQPVGEPGGVEPKKEEKLNPPKIIGLVVLGILFLIGGVFGVITLLKQKEEPPKPEPEPEPIEAGIEVSEFDLSFMKMEESKANMIYSPLSIKYGMSLLRDGADNETKEEIDDVLGNIKLTKYDNVKDVLSLANAVIIRTDFKDNVLPDYISGVEEKYNAEVFYDSLVDASAVDSWIDDKTFGLIKTSGVNINPDTKMVLANALAIQMDWARRFDGMSTYGRDFTKADGTVIEATTMVIEDSTEDIEYYVGDDVTVVSKNLKDYDGTQLEFVAVMPEGDSSEYVQNVEPDDLNEVLSKTQEASTAKDGVILRIPKFKFDYQLQFIDDLKQLGIKSAFENTADFSKLDVNNELKIGDAVHKATIDFSEEGIKAAAITVFAMDEKSAFMEEEPQPIEININKPFIFIIRDKNTGENWFVGAVYEPNLWENDRAEYDL